jgi:hypothetical protein
LSFSAAYTWGHSIDNVPEQFGSGGGGVQDYFDRDGSRGNSNFDVRHRFVTGVVYELPFFKTGVLSHVLGGWQLSSMLMTQTGHPFSPSLTNPRQRLGATAVGTWRPDVIRDARLDERTADRWFDTGAFVLPRNPDGSFRFGNAGRSILTGDGDFNVDFGLMKNFRLTERLALQFRWETFNITNTPTLADPNSNFDSPDFGVIRGTVSVPRQMQFALRLAF